MNRVVNLLVIALICLASLGGGSEPTPAPPHARPFSSAGEKAAWFWDRLIASRSQSAQGLDGPSDDLTKMVQGLRERSLYDLADAYVQRWLARKDLEPAAQGSLIIEQIRTQMARAVQTPLAERPGAWDQAVRIGDDFLRDHPQHPRRPLIEIQQALALQAEGRLISAEAKIGIADGTSRERGLKQLREARRRLEQIERDVKKLLPQAPDKPTSDGRLTNEQLHAVAANARFQGALTSLEMAGFYPADDRLNRIDVLVSVVSRLEDTIRQVDAKNPLAIAARLRLVEAHRLAGEYASGERILSELPPTNLPDDLEQLRAEQTLLLAVERGEPRSAIGLLESLEATPAAKPVVQLAMLQTMLALAEKSAGAEREDWLRRAAKLIGQIEALHGGYWAQLAEKTLVQRLGSAASAAQPNMASRGSAASEMIVRVGDAAFREERWGDARQAYETAVTEALANQQHAAALSLALKSAQASEKLREHQAAADRLLSVVAVAADDRLAPAAHLRAAWNVSQLAQDPAQKSRFQELLREHLERFPQSETCDQARLWLARLLLAEERTTEAISLYLQIPHTSSSAPQAARDLRVAIPKHLAVLRGEEPSRASEAALAILADTWTRLEQSASEDSRLTEADAQLAIAIAPLVVEFRPEQAGQLARLLELARLAPGAAQSEWYPLNTASLVGLYAIAGDQPQRERELFEELRANRSALLYVYDLLGKSPLMAGNSTQAFDQRLGDLLTTLEANATDANDKIRWQWERAKHLLAQGQTAEARTILQSLATSVPNRIDIQVALARALSADAATYPAALDQWRRVSAKLKEQSEDWFEARYEIARLLFETGQKDRAAEVLRFMQAVPPGWSQSKKRAEFDALFEKVSK